MTTARTAAHRTARDRRTRRAELDVTAAVRRFRRVASVLPRTALLYDVATRSDEALLVSLAREGAGFAVGDPSAVPPLGATSQLLSTARLTSCEDVAALATAGVRQFVVRSAEETCRVAIAAPGSSVLVRVVPLATAGDAAQDQGCTVAEAVTVLRQACASGLDIAGVSFEIASLRRSPRAWASAVGASARVFGAAAEVGLRLDTIDLGGGLPGARGRRAPAGGVRRDPRARPAPGVRPRPPPHARAGRPRRRRPRRRRLNLSAAGRESRPEVR